MKMKKILLLIILSIFSYIYSYSQNKGSVGISLGPSIPIGGFASKDINNNSAGYAKTGALLDISLSYKLGKYFGVSALLRGQTDNFDNASFGIDLANQTGSNWSVSSKPWSMGGLMLGGYGSFLVSQKVSFDIKALIGFLRVTSPEINTTLSGSGGSGWLKQNSVVSTSFSYILSGGFKLDIGKKTYLLTNLDYLASNPEFRNVEVVSSLGGAPQISTFRQNIQTINFSLGIGLKF